MHRKLVTCPETAHLEEIWFDDHPLGILIVRCSRFAPACVMTCPRTCAARLDKRDHDRTDPDVASRDNTQVVSLR